MSINDLEKDKLKFAEGAEAIRVLVTTFLEAHYGPRCQKKHIDCACCLRYMALDYATANPYDEDKEW